MSSNEVKFQALNAMTDKLYKLVDMADLLQSEAMEDEVGAILDRLLGDSVSKVEELIDRYGV